MNGWDHAWGTCWRFEEEEETENTIQSRFSFKFYIASILNFELYVEIILRVNVY